MKSKTVGIWMDHSTANLIDNNSKKKNRSIESKFNFEMKTEALSRSENIMHNKENQLQEAYYKEIGLAINGYEHILLFGPTNASTELHNYLNKDLHFKNVRFDIEPADKMTENEKNAFVLSHFEKKLN